MVIASPPGGGERRQPLALLDRQRPRASLPVVFRTTRALDTLPSPPMFKASMTVPLTVGELLVARLKQVWAREP